MRIAAVVCFAVSMIGCGRFAALPTVSPERLQSFNACKTVPTAFSDEAPRRDWSERVRRSGRVLHIGSVKLTDRYDEDGEYARHSYVGRLAGVPLDLVHVRLYEGESWIVIDDSSRVTHLAGAPVVSPDDATLAVAANGDPHYSSSAAIYQLGPDGLRLVLEADIYPPCGGRWEGPDRFSFSTYTEFWDGPGELKIVPAALAREKGVWRYEGLRAPAN